MKELLLRSNLFMLVTIILTQLVNGQIFTEHVSLTEVGNSSSAWGDYDNDGDLDLLVTGSNTSIIYHNDGGVFTDIGAGLTGVSYGSVAWGDYDNDGDLDILLTGSYYAIIYRNNAGNFTDIDAGLPGVTYSSAAWGDYDNDGDLDILITGVTSSNDRISRVYRNDNGFFTDIMAGLPGVMYGSVAWGDYDNDHDLDIILSGQTTTGERISRIYRNGNGIFSDINAGLYGTNYSSVAWGDYDSDGDLDLMISGANIAKLYRNDNGTFNEVITGLPGLTYSSVAWGDCDNDGDLDLLITGNASGIGTISRVYLNDKGTFADSGADLVGIARGSALWGDFNKDGKLDILLSGNGYSRIYRNNAAAANTVPVAPSALTATPSGSGMILSWNKSTDDQTAQAGLSYNLYIGTASGAVNKRSPMALLPDGYRRIVMKGDIQSNSWTIKRLPASTYFWSVQAIDNNFAGSPFATQTTFSVPFYSSVSPSAGQVISVNQPAATLTVSESSSPTSRQWKHSSVSGGPYSKSFAGATGLTCSPSFTSTGTYYVVCESVKSGVAYISNEVKIIVSDFIVQTGIVLPALKNSSVVWGDYDSDGDLDLFISGYNDSEGALSRIYRNDAGVFTDIVAGLQGVSYGSAAWGDYDNDGDLDLVVTGEGFSKIYRNDNGVFNDISAGLTGVYYSSVAWGDFDNDGDLDLLLSGNSGYPVTLLYRNDGGIFYDIGANLPGIYIGSLSWGDYDSDGDLDILISGQTGSTNISRVYQNNKGLFSDINAGLAGVASGSAVWGDYDSDGDLDVLLTGNNTVYIYNNSNGNFAQITTPIPAVNNSSAVWGDFDNDGDLDILITGNSVSDLISRIYRNNGGIFSEVSSGLAPVKNGSVAWGDYDNDGDLDIIITGTSLTSDVSLVYKNMTAIPNSVPSTPSGLTVLNEPNRVLFSWDKSTDTQTPQDGLSYDIYIRTQDGSANIRMPMSSLSSGYRRVVRSGLQGNSWYLDGLTSGDYTWTVQAVDHSFAGSQFAPENSFSVPYSTSISPEETQTIIINQSGISLTVTETTPAGSRQWKYSKTPGGSYDNTIAGATAPSYIPVFAEWGTYYVVCESTKDSKVYRSNEVKINVPLFSAVSTPEISGAFNGSVSWGDYDGNGDLDILAGGGGSGTYIYQNNSGAFNNTWGSYPSIQGGCALWGDWDNDGDLDFLSVGGQTRTYINNSGVFSPASVFPPFVNSSAAWGDYDNDGDLDILISGNYLTKIYRNDNGNFTDINAGLTGVRYGSVAWGDYDNDGDLDILLTGQTTTGYITRIYRNNNGSFTGIKTGIPGIVNSSAVWGDYDNDGDLDVLMSGRLETGELITRLYRNDNGIFPDVGAGLPGLHYSSVSWGDYDNDGDLDLLICGATETSGVYFSAIYRNDNGIFTDINAGLTGVRDGSAAWGDYDNDGDIDLIINGESASSGLITTLYRNNITVPNDAPSMPSNLQSVVSSNKVSLTWSKSTDSKTPQSGLAYNVYISMPPSLLGPPMADVSDGYRRIPAKENQVNLRAIKDLPVGTYNWSVQAIDNTFAGSAFADEASFTVLFTNSVAPVGEQVLDLSQNGSPLTITESSVADSRQWKYSTVSGGPYNQVITGETGTTYTPCFTTFGTFYLVCESVYNSNTYLSNEVKIHVPLFTEQTAISLPGVYSGSVDWGDYDNGGDLDMIIAGNNVANIYRNDGGTFSFINAGLPGVYGAFVKWCDYDNDGDLDLFLSGSASTGLISRIYRNDAGVFTDIKAGLPGIAYGSAAWGDYDGDGNQDLLISGNNITAVFRNDKGSFTNIDALMPGLTYTSVAWGDYDNDGDLDILITGGAGTTGVSRIFRNDKGDFIDIDAGLAGVYRGTTAWGDYDNDGDLDIIMSGLSGTDPVTLIYRNDGGTFTDISAGLPGVFNSSLAWGDYDNDGDLDILLSGDNGAQEITRIYRNDGGLFTDIKDGLTGVHVSSLAWGDYDNDGDLDILLTGAGPDNYISKVYRNNIPASNDLPAAPSNLQSAEGANMVTLSWNKSTDATTPQNGLTYNVYIGTSPGTIDITSPQASLPGGFRKIARAEYKANSRIIRNLPAGTYYWSVQAIDNSFGGSPFATESSFSVNFSNSVSPSADQSLAINQNGALLTVTESAPADSRQWKYSTVRGGPYDHVITGAAGTTYTPGFHAWGTYYVVCESTKDAIVYNSNEVKITLPVFLEQTGISMIGLRWGSAKWGDYDNDSDLDILLTGFSNEGNFSKIYRNDNGIFTDINANLTGVYQATAIWGDYDNDGDLDLFLGGFISSMNYISKIYRNDSGVFTDIAAGLPALNMCTAAWADYDNDGDLDILISGMIYTGGITNYVTQLYRNDNGVFSDTGAGFPGLYTGFVAWADYDNDGDQDILITGVTYTGIRMSRIYRNDNGTFTDLNAGLPGVYYSSAAWGDYDNDGDLDLIIMGLTDATGARISVIYRNDNGVFTDIGAGLPGLYTGSAAWGDYDNDGDLDLILSGSGTTGFISDVYKNTNGVFERINAGLQAVYQSSVAWGDYDNDGSLDILMLGFDGSSNYSLIYKNTAITSNTPPSAPSGLTVNVANLSQVSLSWDKASDSETAQNTLNYNVRVGSSAGASDILSPMANAGTGYRRIPARGNTDFRNTGYNLKNLSPGTYYWSVQAIDQAYAGGAWAEESKFTLLAGPAATAATDVLQISFYANWGSVSLATGYKLDVATDALFTTFLNGYEDKDAGNVLNAQVTGITASTTYYYRVRAYQAGGTSLIYSNTITVTTPVEVPVPTANPATSISQTGFTANWTIVASAVSYSLDVATDDSFTTFVAGYNNKNVGDVTAGDVAGLTANTTYYYRVRANGTVGSSVNSNTVSVTTLPIPPETPAGIAAESITSAGFVLRWHSSPTATTYYLDISTVNDFASFITGYNDFNNGSDTSNTVTGLSPSATYYFRVRAGNAGGTSSSSGTTSATTMPEIPAAPLAASAGNTGQTMFTANWSASTGAEAYRLDVSADAGFATALTGFDNLDAGNVISYDVPGLTAKTVYYYRVRAYNVSGTSANSNSVTVTTLPDPPSAPSGLTASSCNDLVTLSWTANTEADFQKYIIYGDTTTNPTTRIDSTLTISSVTKTLSGLTSGQTYYFRITAVISPGVASQYSTPVSVKVKKGVIPMIKSKFSGDVLVCYNIGDSISSWQWYRGGTAISGATKQYYFTGGNRDSFSVLTTDKDGCINSSNVIDLSGSGSLTVYPNPAKENFTLRLNTEHSGRTLISLYNPAGVKISQYQTDKTDEEFEYMIPVGKLPDGLYTVIIVINEEEVAYSRVMVIN